MLSSFSSLGKGTLFHSLYQAPLTSPNCTLSAAGSLCSLLGFSRSRPTAAKATIPALPNFYAAWPRCSRAGWEVRVRGCKRA